MKDADWFKHDSNAKDDPKCVLLIEQLGLEGFGIYWVLIEILREQPNYHYPLALIPSIARRYNTSTQKVEAVIKGYGLFATSDEEFFFSESLINRMKPLENQRELARIAGLASAEKRRKQALSNACSTPVQRSFNDRSTIREEKKREEESRVDKNIYKDIVSFLNEKTNSKFRFETKSTQSQINARLEEKFTIEDFKSVISFKANKWLGTDMQEYLRPQTLFGTKFESYLSEAKRNEPKPEKPREPEPQFESEEQRIAQNEFVANLLRGQKPAIDLERMLE